MENRNNVTIPLCIIAACLAGVCGFYAGKNALSSISETEHAVTEPSVQETEVQETPVTEPTELQ